ncbi:MAG TPA: hypothetical protein PKZ57_04375 [Methanoregulaceae archaeon]|nr:hypothetical protein [Methanoregulaceae archaeon]
MVKDNTVYTNITNLDETSLREGKPDMNVSIEKYQYWQEYLTAAHIDIKSSLRMVDAMLDIVQYPENILSSPEMCGDLQNLAERLKSFITTRMVALDDLITILRTHGICVVPPEE